MKNVLRKVTFAITVFFICLVFCNAYALDINAIFGQLKAQLQNSGMVSTDINAVESPVKNLLAQGVSQIDLKSMLLDFVSKGFKGKDLSSLVSMVGDLVKSGSSAKSSAGFVSQAIQQVSAMGLKGNGLMAKVQGIVGQKKASLDLLSQKGIGSLFGK